MDNCHCWFGGVQKAEGITAINIHDCVQVDPPHALEHTDIKRILGKHFPRPAALNMPLPEAGIGLLDPGHLLRAQLDLVLETALFELE